MINNTYFTTNVNLKNNDNLPSNMCYFFEGDFTEIINIDDSKNDIDTVISAYAFIDIVNYKLQKYTKSNSYAGISLPTNKLIVELNLSRHIKYVYNELILATSMINLENCTKIISIGIPNKICNMKIEDVVRRGELTITAHIENVFFKKISSKEILLSISALVNIKF